MKRISTLFLRIAIIVIAVGTLAFCCIAIPSIWGDVPKNFPDCAYAVYTIFSAMYLAAVPFFVGLVSGWRLLSYIDRGEPFSKRSVKAVGTIAVAAAIICLIFSASLPFFYIWAQYVDAPGLMVIGLGLAGGPMVVAVFAALLQKLIAEAVDLKSENELTV